MNKYCICKVLLDSRITPPNLPIFFNLRNPQNFILINSSNKNNHKVCRHALRIPIVII